MNTDELNKIVKAYWGNYNRTYSQQISLEKDQEGHAVADRIRNGIATAATVIDYLRGNIEGISTCGEKDMILLKALEDLKVKNDGFPQPAEPNDDPNPIATEVMKRLGELGLQSLKEIQGFKFDSNNHLLVLTNNRFADTGWIEGDPRIEELSAIMNEFDSSNTFSIKN